MKEPLRSAVIDHGDCPVCGKGVTHVIEVGKIGPIRSEVCAEDGILYCHDETVNILENGVSFDCDVYTVDEPNDVELPIRLEDMLDHVGPMPLSLVADSIHWDEEKLLYQLFNDPDTELMVRNG